MIARSVRRARTAVFAALAAAAPLHAQAAAPDAPPSSPQAAEVRRIADTYLADVVTRFPGAQARLGPAPAPERWVDNSLAAQADWERAQDAYLAQLRGIDADALYGQPEWLVLGMLRESLEASVAQRVCRYELWQGVDQIFGWHLTLSTQAGVPQVDTEADRARTLARWRDVPRFASVEIENLREGLASGYTAPRPNVERVIQQLRGMTDSIEGSPFWALTTHTQDEAYARQMAAIVRGDVVPALRRYLAFLETEYLPRARTDVGLWAIPNGAECYRGVVRGYTSLDIAPEELQSAARAARLELEAELLPLARQVTGEAELGAARARLKTDPRFAFASRDAKLAEARAQMDTLRMLMPRAFSRVPATPVIVEAGPAYTEASRPGAWYDSAPMDGSRPATFWLNLGNAERSPRMDLATATSHEGWPGHHLQQAWVRERPVAHPVMRLLGTGSYVEGWGMYAERVADEIGAFGDPLMRAGVYSHLADALVALEIDPGVHVFHWTREQAVDSMTTISRRPRAQAEVYADRHAATPGQLISYMTGYLEIMRLREHARRELGAAFDIREFHDVVLDDGAVTLPMLRAKVEHWIASKK
jgi:uncharacterized protein (DUF885 family)